MIASDTELAVGADLGGTKVLGAIVDRQGNVIAERRLPTPHDGDLLLDAIADLVRELEVRAGRQAIGLGVGAAGLIDRRGNMHFSPNVGGISNVDLLGGMQARLPGHAVRIDNDANAATWGECLMGAGKRRGDLVMATLGTGIGGGIVTGGRLFKGHNGFGAEIGHLTVEARGVLCACGKSGCWEAYASGRALGRLGREAAQAGTMEQTLDLVGGDVQKIRGEHVTSAARAGDPAALAVMDEFAYWLAVGIASLVTVLDPDIVVIGGGLAEEADLYLDRTSRHLEDIVFGARFRPPVPLVVAELGERAGAVGAAMLVHGEEIPEA